MAIEAATGPIVCGHRGAPAVSPENTLASFAAAADRGATWVEFDVRPTADRELIIHHDPATSDGIHLASTAYGEIPASIPRFKDLVQAMPDIGLDIEIKTDDVGLSTEDYVDLVISEIDANLSNFTNVMVTSFDDKALGYLAAQRPEIPTGLLFWNRTGSWAIETALAAGHVAIVPSIKLLTSEMVEQAKAQGLDVATWTVNTPKQIALAKSAGVDMIIGDDPAVIIEHI